METAPAVGTTVGEDEGFELVSMTVVEAALPGPVGVGVVAGELTEYEAVGVADVDPLDETDEGSTTGS